ncbi:hypothetical protein [Chondromyces apiculatus]|uniref:hypothetical protein n=1 Tax=Chondromyces apiculatus TaxID=51 RepID=UPI0005C6385A|nr:hypothetical protein [Chondromyces apiculatus]
MGAPYEKVAPPLRFDSAAEIPPEDTGEFAPAERRVNTGKAGKILVGVGLGIAALSGLMAAVGAAGMQRGGGDVRAYGEALTMVGVGGMALGGVSVVVGIPLWVASPR